MPETAPRKVAEPARAGTGDLLVVVLLTILGAAAVWFLPPGNVLRILLAASVLLFAPGYLLIEAAVVPGGRGQGRLVHGAMAIGASIGLVGVLALGTALVPGGFRPEPMVAVVTAASLTCAALANFRRRADAEKTGPTTVARSTDRESPAPVVFEPAPGAMPIVDPPTVPPRPPHSPRLEETSLPGAPLPPTLAYTTAQPAPEVIAETIESGTAALSDAPSHGQDTSNVNPEPAARAATIAGEEVPSAPPTASTAAQTLQSGSGAPAPSAAPTIDARSA
ncbi:MAG TPA: DUF1616 domain-containing protein [Candidatus Thermoplasmatota archaeon]|nr:DUF1616 domain-containing protein [Candidatus Thermoplasmatota archaeon]